MNALNWSWITEEAPEEAPKDSTQGEIIDIRSLQYTRAKEAEDAERAREVYRKYQENIVKIEGKLAAIEQGLNRGDNICILFLQATEALGMLVNDKNLPERAKLKLLSIYAEGLKQPEALEAELAEVKGRLEHLEEALKTAAPEQRIAIERAIREHINQANEITLQLT